MMYLEITSSDISMVIGFFIGLLGSKAIDIVTDRLYYRGNVRRNKPLKVVDNGENKP